jgi:UDPglucose 6-dehydrogenase
MSTYTIGVLGLWHLGEIYTAGLSELGHKVVGIGDDKAVVENLSRDIPPLPEPQLEKLLESNRKAGRLKFTEDISEVRNCNVLWITFDTPVDDNDEADLTVVYDALLKAIPHLQNGVLLVVTSQVPVGTSQKIKDFIHAKRPDITFDYVYTPENLRLGEAVRCFFEPGRIVIGAETQEAFQKIEEIFSGLHAEFMRMSPPSAEMAKHALNAFLATSVSFINDIADICEQVGADVLDVVKALRSDPRVGEKAFLSPGLGFSGGTLGRDLKALSAVSKNFNVNPLVIESVYKKNALRKNLVMDRLLSKLGNMKGKTIAIFGLTYKAGTKTLRRSRALEVAKDLSGADALVRLHDPYADKEEIPHIANTIFFSDPYEAAENAHAVVLVTPWPEFKNLDFKKLKSVVQPPNLFFDTANFLSNKMTDISSMGFIYLGIGRRK